MSTPLRLGVNIDHVATLRQARGTPYPIPLEAARLAAAAGADSITVHLREDRRHIQPHDVEQLVMHCPVPVNLELALDEDIIEFACRVRPAYACIVPERREERTTEGGLDIEGHLHRLKTTCRRLSNAGVKVALFVEPDAGLLDACKEIGAPQLEIHTGRFADAFNFEASAIEFVDVDIFAKAAVAAGFEVHAGHGLNIHNVGSLASIHEIVEFNIGHALVSRAVMVGMEQAVREFRAEMDRGRASGRA